MPARAAAIGAFNGQDEDREPADCAQRARSNALWDVLGRGLEALNGLCVAFRLGFVTPAGEAW